MDQLFIILEVVVPVFAILGLGFWLAGRRAYDLSTLANLAFWIAAPCFVFELLAEAEVNPREWQVLLGGTLFLVLGTGVLGALYVWRFAPGQRGLLLPIMFWNAGNMAIPCVTYAFGEEAMRLAAIVFVLQACLLSTLGIWIGKGSGGVREIGRLPLVFACALGLGVALLDLTVPALVMRPVSMLGSMAIPLMLINLGSQLRKLQVQELRHSLVSQVLRIGGGFLLGLLFVTWFSIDGVLRQVLLLESVMPPAAINIIIAQRYDTNPTLVASAIVMGTTASLLVIPLVLCFLV